VSAALGKFKLGQMREEESPSDKRTLNLSAGAKEKGHQVDAPREEGKNRKAGREG